MRTESSLKSWLAGCYSGEQCFAEEIPLYSWLQCVTNLHLFWD